jgi:hypothetical protein
VSLPIQKVNILELICERLSAWIETLESDLLDAWTSGNFYEIISSAERANRCEAWLNIDVIATQQIANATDVIAG